MFAYSILLFYFCTCVYATQNVFQLQKEVDGLKSVVRDLVDANVRMAQNMTRIESRFQTEMAEFRENNRCHCSSENTNQKRLLMTDQPPVSNSLHRSFYAQLSTNLQHLVTKQIVLFDRIQLNIGNSYSALDGEFVCTLQGIYFMSWTITCSDNTAIETELVVNGNVKGNIFTDAGNHADYETNSGSALLQLNIGDRVWIRVGAQYNGQIVGANLGSSTFLGFLVN